LSLILLNIGFTVRGRFFLIKSWSIII